MGHALEPVMRRLIDRLETTLPETEVQHLRSLVDASQPGLALEWITDAVTQRGLTSDPSLRQLLVQLGTQLGIAASIRTRLEG
ncbi:MAG: hypothetical protein JNK82_44010 [Myxococcaceae bacterium]|nr:hypothetical protein [Myxococcaceae bacterium]